MLERIGTVVTMLLGVGLIGYARLLPRTVLAGQPEFIGPSFFPIIVGAFLIFLSIVQFCIMGEKAKNEERPEKNKINKFSAFGGGMGLAAYVFFIPILGFYVTTFGFLCLFFFLPGSLIETRRRVLLGYVFLSFLITISIYLLFERILWVHPPRGILF